jgi:hypothetical protein
MIDSFSKEGAGDNNAELPPRRVSSPIQFNHVLYTTEYAISAEKIETALNKGFEFG